MEIELERITTEKAPKAVGPYSQAVRTGNTIFTSGQIPLDPETGEIVGENARDQAVQVFENLSAVLVAAGSSLQHIVKVTCFLDDMNDFAAVNTVFSHYFGTEYPARSCVEVSALPKAVKVEIEAIALVGK